MLIGLNKSPPATRENKALDAKELEKFQSVSTSFALKTKNIFILRLLVQSQAIYKIFKKRLFSLKQTKTILKNIATRWDPYIIWWDPYDSYPHDSDLFILFEVCNNSLKGSSYIIYPILYTLIY